MLRAILAVGLALLGCTAPALVVPSPSPTAATEVVASPSPLATSTATRPTATPQLASEDAAWAAVQAALPAAPLIRPTWLPDTVDRRAVAYLVDGSSYRVTYRMNGGDRLGVFFAFGPQPTLLPPPVSMVGIRVRGVPAVFAFPATDFSSMRVSWREGASDLAIQIGEIRGEDLLQIAWSLDPPAPQTPRARVGACAPDRAPPDAVVRRLFELASSGDAAAVADCWSRDRVAEDTSVFAHWSVLGPTSQLDIRYSSRIAERYWVMVTFTFARDPSAFQGPHKTLFYQVGVEEGRWRIFETATGIYFLPPFEPRPRVLPVAEAFGTVRAETGLPALVPSLPLHQGLVGEIGPAQHPGSVVLLRDDIRGIRIRLSVAVHNVPPPTQRGTQARLAFRSDPQAFYQVSDATVPTSFRYLEWSEPNTSGCDRCGYAFSTQGLDEQTFWAVARSLR